MVALALLVHRMMSWWCQIVLSDNDLCGTLIHSLTILCLSFCEMHAALVMDTAMLWNLNVACGSYSDSYLQS